MRTKGWRRRRERVLQGIGTWLFIIHLTNTCTQSTLYFSPTDRCFLRRASPTCPPLFAYPSLLGDLGLSSGRDGMALNEVYS
ncbi:hypothetical protein E2C01_078303 [Portunus trituberculatus]|uniref:Uncharacterized protein n=1 Tax=Portunus trituberculatus TaxID=210409 RepID=A0A5B7IDY6_PORTR|nr:hypothetical protein [Portunus trituberculatus]